MLHWFVEHKLCYKFKVKSYTHHDGGGRLPETPAEHCMKALELENNKELGFNSYRINQLGEIDQIKHTKLA